MAVSRYAFNEALATLEIEAQGDELPDKKLIRQAYSRQAKIRRPDTDPQGFQEVRQAYEIALEALADGIYDFDRYDEDAFDDEDGDEAEVLESTSAPDQAAAAQPEPTPETSTETTAETPAETTTDTNRAPARPVPATQLPAQDIPALYTPPAHAELDLPSLGTGTGKSGYKQGDKPPTPLPAAPSWLETLEREKEELATKRNALFDLLTATPQDAAQLIQETHKLLQLPALDQLEHRIEVYGWLRTLAAWHPAATPAWRTLIAVASGLNADSPEPAHDDTEARLIQRLLADRDLDTFRRRATVNPDSAEAVWTAGKTKGTRWWRLARRALNSDTRQATDEARDWLESQAPDDVRPEAVARWNNAKQLAPLGTHRTALLAVFFLLLVFGPLERALGSLAAVILGAASTFGLTLLSLLAFGGGLDWLRTRVLEPFKWQWSVLEVVLGALILASAAMASNSAGSAPDSALEPVFEWVFIWTFALAIAVWTLCGSIGFMVRASPLEWVGWAQFWGVFAIAIYAASGAAHFTLPAGLAAIVLLLACHPDGPIKRYASWTFALRGGDFFSLPPKAAITTLSALHVMHAALCISLPQDSLWIQLLLVSTGILLLYADVLLMGLPIGDGDGIGRFMLIGIIIMPVIVQSFKDAGPGYEKAFLDALCLIPLGLAFLRERKSAAPAN